ncbi:restriction endonuclease subunit S, partial [Bacillus velezensis]
IKANMFCYNINCGGTPSKDISEEGEIPFLKVYNIVNNKVDFSYKPQYIPKEVHKSKLKKSMLRPNDVIMNIVGPPLKKIAIIPEEYSEMNMNQAIVRFRPIKYVLPKYLYYCLQYDETLRDVINKTRGVVGQSNISVSQSRNLVMPIPSIEEQAEIVSKLEEMIKREEIVLSLVSDEKNLDELKQSILSKAFRGELGTNDPSEESAIELLKEVLQEQVK